VPVLTDRRGANPPNFEDAIRFLGRRASGLSLLRENLADLSVPIHRVSYVARETRNLSVLAGITQS
jgi:hypothetical protein